MCENLWRCVDHIAELSERTGKQLHLGLEPEPLCYLETSEETVRFVERLRTDIGIPIRLRDLGVKESQLPLFAEKACGIKRILRVNPRLVTVEDALGILREAF